MNKDILLLSLIVVGTLGYLTAYSMGPPLYAKEEKKAAPCPEGEAGEEAGGYGEEAGGYGEEAGGYGDEAEAAAPCPEGEAGEEAGGYGEEAGGYGSELGYL